MRMLIATGGTGGHIYPALALADAAQDIAQFAAQQRGFAQCLFHSVTVAVLF